ncbi:LysR family transcriptional regulator [Burkholderia sp. TSV86]|uniref:LysR family transcriptional regulator n=1 Tax=Burkholderia sp. TSV86 TaxID=1385594 RepID=UPI0012E380B8|nr:LysR family transcriptional regulator [Burkholderia sp. TSV86]
MRITPVSKKLRQRFDEFMRISHFNAFRAVAETGSFSSAAAELGCTQSNISHAISEVEKFVGERLFVRSRAGCVLTDAGAELIIKTGNLLDIVNDMLGKTLSSRPVRISTLRSVGTGLLAQLMSDLSKVRADIRVEILDDTEREESVLDVLNELGADIAIITNMEAEKYISRAFVKDRYVAVLPPDIAMQGTLRWDQLQSLNFIQQNNPHSIQAVASLRNYGVHLRSFYKIASVDSILSMVENGVGFSIVPQLALPENPKTYRIAVLPQLIERELVVLSRPYSMLSHAARTVLDFICDKPTLRKTSAYRRQVIELAA